MFIFSYLSGEATNDDFFLTGWYTNDSNLDFAFYYKFGDMNINYIPILTSNHVWTSFVTIIDDDLYIGGNYNDQIFIYKLGDSQIEKLSIFNNYLVLDVKSVYDHYNNEHYLYGEINLFNNTGSNAFYYKIGDLDISIIPNPPNSLGNARDSVILNNDLYFCGSYYVIGENKNYAYYYIAGEDCLNVIPMPENTILSFANGIVAHNENIIITGHYYDINSVAYAYYFIIGEDAINIIPFDSESIEGISGLDITVFKDDVYILGNLRNEIPISYYYRIGDPFINIIPDSEHCYINNAIAGKNNMYFAGHNFIDNIWQVCYFDFATKRMYIIPSNENIVRIQVNAAIIKY